MQIDKKRICVDFDGVIHSYTSGWQGADVIPDPVVPKAIIMLQTYVRHFNVAIYSARSGQPGGIQAMINYIDKQETAHLKSIGMTDEDIASQTPLVEELEFPASKPPAFIYIDDRGFRFEGVFPSVDILIDDYSTNWIQNAKKV